ncbi:hypothetical protein HH1059_13310 [Halorhodospira halochloris]|uniref:Uncharacterized protein n=1 Tax=Halorhodospira halochloris TaxID=1052 RepID=A0A0X8X9R0_HALHR|nr:hypothetical protein [Halorhodospira halochloris]MBK1652117.1 hypothetical protein [Halorhodospira halochloris]BAU58040.1 hypothetical protein HH1059_13310 [Halorhodospira halochloris]
MNFLERYPSSAEGFDFRAERNPAILLYGRRFYKDQTPLEYLVEFLMAFSSPKDLSGNAELQFKIIPNENERYGYYPKEHIILKLFSFFADSKLDTRHHIHRQTYLYAMHRCKESIDAPEEERDETLKLLQNLMSGFAGISKDRTWVTFTFYPAAKSLISKEVTWQHPKALKESKGEIHDWHSSLRYFDYNTRNFMGRGGELLFLQLANLFEHKDDSDIGSLINKNHYEHLQRNSLAELQDKLENNLSGILNNSVTQLENIASFLENSLHELVPEDEGKSFSAFAWVPRATKKEALLFATEMNNICSSSMGPLEKIDFINKLATIHVMRSLCFQAQRANEDQNHTAGFEGNYVWIASDHKAPANNPARRLSVESYNKIETLLYRALRSPYITPNGTQFSKKEYENADDNCFRHFRKFGKELGIVIPKTGPSQRFALNPELIRFLITALLTPGEYLRLTDFYNRVFAHYGIALGGEPLATALSWLGGGISDKTYGVDINTDWVEEALQQGGYLIELSDAVSIVHNPGREA